MEHSGNTQSVWMATATRPDFAPLARNTSVDVVVVGAGIAGLSTAYLLGREGKSVIVLDGGPILSGETERTTAHLASAMDDRFMELERLHGVEGSRLAAESHAAAIALIERIVREESVDCGFERVDGYLFAPAGGARRFLEEELAAAQRAGLTGATLIDRVPLTTFNTGPALKFPNQAQFHPLRYLSAVANAIVRNGGHIHAHTPVDTIEGGDHAFVRTVAGNVIHARSIVVATNSPINDRVVIHTKQTAYRTYVVGFRISRDLIPTALYWDTAEPYHYIRLAPGPAGGDHDVLIVGGEDHRTGEPDNAEARYRRLEQWTRERFPAGEVTFRWSGQVQEPVDCLGFIGRNPMDRDNVYVATGDSGQGMTHGTLAGLIITDLIIGRENPWARLYDPARSSGTRDLGEFVKDGVSMAMQYAKWLTPGDTDTEDSIPRGSGAVIRQGAHKLAVYCDEEGHLHECSAVCPHLGGIVSWNAGEKSWDCPVHGSRFDCFGKVMSGPAKEDLEPVHVSAKT
jgi:glycine/D-amino acid oxidase-like deaminating enzyme/nitrite reductase/ring-hydroxylating ferredoxin subunit